MTSEKPDILVITPIYAPTLAALERRYTVHKRWLAERRESFVREVAPRIRALVTTGFVGFTRADIDPLPNLEIVACFGNGHGTFDLVAARARGIVVTNTPDRTSETVAELAIALLLAVSRRVCESDRYVRAGRWRGGPGSFGLGRTLSGKTCGILGLGNIGKGIARRAEALGMSVCYHGRRQQAGVPYAYCADVTALAQASDALVIACPLTPDTRGVVDARVLAALGPQGFLVNVGRGPVVEEAALLDALAAKTIAGAGLDVYWDEPDVPAPLRAADNVVLVPHLGSSTVEIREERGAKLLSNLEAHFARRPLPNVVSAGAENR